MKVQEKVKEYDYLYYNLSFGKSFGDPTIIYIQSYNDDIKIPNGSKSIRQGEVPRRIWGDYSEGYYLNYEINANYSQVLDFFLENMIRDGWRVRSEADEISLARSLGVPGLTRHMPEMRLKHLD